MDGAGDEVLFLSWEEVDLDQELVVLTGERAKNGETRPLPFAIGEIEAIIRRRLSARVLGCPWVFHRCHVLGMTVMLERSRFNLVFRKACNEADREEIIFHDCRRTAARNLIRSGVPEHQAMKITGHRSNYVFRRYDIIDKRDLMAVAEKYTPYMRRKAADAEKSRGEVVPFERKGEA